MVFDQTILDSLDKNEVYIGFSAGDSFLAKVIEKFTKSRYSHSFLLMYDSRWQEWMALGADEGGWMYTPSSSENVIDLYHLNGVDLWRGLREYKKYIGSSYDIGGMLGMSVVEVVWHLFRKQIHNPLNARRSWFCSEIIAGILDASGTELELRPEDTDAQMLRNELVTFPFTKLVYHQS